MRSSDTRYRSRIGCCLRVSGDIEVSLLGREVSSEKVEGYQRVSKMPDRKELKFQ